jgi:branched-chain amino acid transport system permease protein
MAHYWHTFQKNRTLIIILAILVVIFLLAIQGMSTRDWVITLLRGLSVGAITFIVASGFSLIFGLLDVLNLAHGTLFMVGAYIGWTVYVRPDTFVDVVTPAALVAVGFVLLPVWKTLLARIAIPVTAARFWPWAALALGLILLIMVLPRYPIAAWDPGVYATSPITYSFQVEQGNLTIPPRPDFRGISPVVGLAVIFLGGILAAGSLAGFGLRRTGLVQSNEDRPPIPLKPALIGLSLAVVGLLFFIFNDPISNYLVNVNHTGLFFISLVVAALTGALMGVIMETALIRPLYTRPIYQLMMTLGVSVIGIELVRGIWGRPEFTMPKPPIFSGTGPGCPANSLADLLANQCSTIMVLGGRVRTYNEIFVPLVGLVVLIAVWLLLKRSRLGMIIRAGVQDSQMVEALGINVRRIFTMVFALGVGLAAMGGTVAAPSMGLSTVMGDNLLLNALIALAIGGLTSFPGAAAGSVLVGMLQQFIIKYGQIGIAIPFTDILFKPTPPLVPASTVLLMVVILLVLPQGLFGRKE